MSVRSLIVLLLAGSGAAAADPSGVYESLDGSALGRLFLTPAERQVLERRRSASESLAAATNFRTDAVASAPSAAPQSEGIGIIVAKGRQPLLWQDGEFVPAEKASAEDIVIPSRYLLDKSRNIGADASATENKQRVEDERPDPNGTRADRIQ